MIIFCNIIKFIILVLVTFFSCQIITNNNKRISYIGVLLICFSSAIVEYINSGLVEAIFFGELIFISINKILENSKYKYIFSIIIPISILGFLLLSNISFQIVIGIAIFSLILWRFLILRIENKDGINIDKTKNKDDINIDKKVIFILIIGCILSIILGCIFYKYTPMKKLENQNSVNYLFSYVYEMLTIINKNIKFENASCLPTFISVFPIGLFIGICYIFKEETKHFTFITINTLVSILELIVIALNLQIDFLPNYILVLGFNLVQIYMILYIFSRVENKLFNLTKSAYLTLIGLVLFMFMPTPHSLVANWMNIAYIIFVLEAYITFNYSDRRFWRLASWVYTVVCLFDFIGSVIVKIV